MSEQDGVDDIGQMITDLCTAGWKPRYGTTWRAPDGTMYSSMATAYRTMKMRDEAERQRIERASAKASTKDH